MGRVILKGYMVVPRPDLAVVLAALPEHIERTRAEEGCLFFDVTQDSDDETKFHVHEEFRSEADFDLHQRRTQASRWAETTKNAARHYRVLTPE